MKIITVKRVAGSLPLGSPIAIYSSDAKGEVELFLREGETILCKRYCEIKAGEERTFNVDQNDGELFAVLENGEERQILGKYKLENSGEKLFLSQKGKDKLSNIPEYEFSERKKRTNRFSRLDGGVKALILVLAVVFILGSIIGGVLLSNYYEKRSRKPKEFDLGEMTITIGKSFVKDNRNKELYAAFYTPESCVLISKVKYEDYPELKEISAVDYCEGIKAFNKNTTSVIVVEDGLTYFVYESQDEFGGKHKFHFYAYKTEEAFWVVQFGSLLDKADYWEPCYHDWAKSVEIK